MKKNLTILSAILITLFLFSFKASAQDDNPQAKSNLTFLGGISTPLSNFGQANYSNNSAGFAKAGPIFGLDAAIYLYKNLAIGITASFQDQGELDFNDVTALANGYNTSFAKDLTNVTAVDRYESINLMAGPQYTFLYKKFTLDLRASAGIIKSISTPYTTINFDNSTSATATFYQLNSTGTAVAYGGSVGLRYSLGDSWDVGIKANYINSDGLKIENTNNPDAGTVGRYVTKQPITELQTTVGITLKF
jgi:hypothetical protein